MKLKRCGKTRGFLMIHNGLRGLPCNALWQGFPAAFITAALLGEDPLAGHTMNCAMLSDAPQISFSSVFIFFSFNPTALVSYSFPFTKPCAGTAVMFPQLLYSDAAKNNFIRV